MTNKIDLNAISKRAEDTSFQTAYVKGDPWKGYEVKDEGNGIVVAETLTKADAEFIVHARQDLPAMIAEVERLQAVQKRLSNRYLKVFVKYIECIDELVPDWRDYMPELVEELAEVLPNAGEKI